MKYDFQGWATKYNVFCPSDGRTILPGAFKQQNGAKVPLVWAHIHDDPTAVLGHAILEHREGEGIWCYGVFNDSEQGQNAKLLVDHGDVDAVSICANQLKQTKDGGVMHGKIRELSLVLAGANDGAHIEPVLAHSDDTEASELLIYTDECIELNHDGMEIPEILNLDESDEIEHEEKGAEEMAENSEKTIGDVVNSMNEEQKHVLYALIGMAMNEVKDESDDKSNDEGDDSEVKHNVFDQEDVRRGNVLTHSDFENIKANAKRAGSWRDAYDEYVADMLTHDDEPEDTTYYDREGNPITYNLNGDGSPYGVGNYEYMFPDARLVGQNPAVIKRDTSWVAKVVNGAKHSPFSRIKTLVADLTEDAARAKGYIKGKYKKEEFFALLKRVTTPTTIYKKQKLDRDDQIDITEWDVVAWLRREMRGMLDEELARAVLVGDGRLADDEDHINPQNIRPIVSDADLYTVKIDIDDSGVETTGSRARDFINAVIWNRKKYKGSGEPTMFCQEDILTECLMLTDEIGRDLYENVAKLATKLRVKEIVSVPVLENTEVLGIMVNMNDYTIGADKGGAISMFDDFDIDYNQQKYLIETRCSGALTLPYSAMVFKQTVSSGGDNADTPSDPTVVSG